MITFNIAGFLTDFTAGRSVVNISTAPKNVGEALVELWQIYPHLRDRVLTERGQVRMHVNIFLEDENIRRKELLDTPLPENCEITILPAVSGGSGPDLLIPADDLT
jgi:molybdopterin synthase sulfur carrier subunit